VEVCEVREAWLAAALVLAGMLPASEPKPGKQPEDCQVRLIGPAIMVKTLQVEPDFILALIGNGKCRFTDGLELSQITEGTFIAGYLEIISDNAAVAHHVKVLNNKEK
jgi:hypothetical protein